MGALRVEGVSERQPYVNPDRDVQYQDCQTTAHKSLCGRRERGEGCANWGEDEAGGGFGVRLPGFFGGFPGFFFWFSRGFFYKVIKKFFRVFFFWGGFFGFFFLVFILTY